MALGRKSAWREPFGSERGVICEINPTTLQPTSAYYQLPIIDESELTDTTPLEEDKTEGNVYYKEGTRELNLRIVTKQRDTDTYEFLTANQGKYFRVIKEMNYKAIDGKVQYYIVAKAKLAKSITIKLPDPQLEWTLKPEVNDIAVGIDLSCANIQNQGFTGALTGMTTIDANAIYKVFEVSAL